MSIVLINRYFSPDLSATSQLLSDLAGALTRSPKHGLSITVITSRQRYDDISDWLPARETINGVSVHRVWTTRFGRKNLLGRAIDYLTFFVSMALKLTTLADPDDIVIAKTDPPMLSVVVAPICWLRGAKLVNWLQDVFPEIATSLDVGRGALGRLAFRMLGTLRTRSLKTAAKNVVVGTRMHEHLTRLGVAPSSIAIVPNWSDGRAVLPLSHDQNRLHETWGLSGRFVVGYSGNLGRAHDFRTFLEAMRRTVRNTAAVPGSEPMAASFSTPHGGDRNPPMTWLFIGSGALTAELKAEVAAAGLSQDAVFQPYQPRERLAESLSVAHVHLVSLRPELEGLVVPSKFYGIAAAGRPTIFIGDPDGEIARLLAEHDCGITVRQGDGEGLYQAIERLRMDPILCARMGANARRAFEAEWDLPRAMARWNALLVEVEAMT